jgi:hypothetical protein
MLTKPRAVNLNWSPRVVASLPEAVIARTQELGRSIDSATEAALGASARL